MDGQGTLAIPARASYECSLSKSKHTRKPSKRSWPAALEGTKIKDEEIEESGMMEMHPTAPWDGLCIQARYRINRYRHYCVDVSLHT